MNAFTKTMSRGDLKHKWKAIMKESPSDFFTETDFRLKENYINTMLRNYNEEDVKVKFNYKIFHPCPTVLF